MRTVKREESRGSVGSNRVGRLFCASCAALPVALSKRSAPTTTTTTITMALVSGPRRRRRVEKMKKETSNTWKRKPPRRFGPFFFTFPLIEMSGKMEEDLSSFSLY